MLPKHTFLLVGVLLSLSLSPAAGLAQDYVDESRTIETPQSTTERFQFTLGKDDAYPHFELSIHLSQGRADLSILGPAGRRLQSVGAQDCTLALAPVPSATNPGTYAAELATTDAVGQWHLRICGGPTPPKLPLGPSLASAAAMLLVAIASVTIARLRTGAAWRWFWAGAALWTVAVAVKFAIAIPLNGPLLKALQASLPHWAYLALGTVYGGAMTGVTEVLFTLLAALIWRRMASTAARAVGIGVGAGAFEAALLTIAALSAAFLVPDAGITNWSVMLAPASERLVAILCHTAARVLVLLAVASRRWTLFWAGFLLLSAVDAVAMYLPLSGQLTLLSQWTVQAIIAPFGLLSIPIILWSVGHWPAAQPAAASEPPAGQDAGAL
jgi:hypothetical protein